VFGANPGHRPTSSPAKNSTPEGEVEVVVFSLLKKKVSPRDFVIELEQSPTLVRNLPEDWERLGGRAAQQARHVGQEEVDL
jgi:hypothetical protein